MKKRLFLVRHAQTENTGLDDFSRKLTEKGIFDSRKVGKMLAESGLKPEKIYSSSANRAFATARLIAEQTGYAASKIEASEELYFSSPDKLMRFVNQIPDELNFVIIVNHNPTVTLFVELLIGYTIPMMQPASVAMLVFDTDKWAYVSEHTATLEKLVSPDEILL
jgi:phosphohistidine phosphatase